MASSKLKVTLIKSKFGRLPVHKECLKGLGLRKINQTVQLMDTKETRGLINKVSYLLKIEGI